MMRRVLCLLLAALCLSLCLLPISQAQSDSSSSPSSAASAVSSSPSSAPAALASSTSSLAPVAASSASSSSAAAVVVAASSSPSSSASSAAPAATSGSSSSAAVAPAASSMSSAAAMGSSGSSSGSSAAPAMTSGSSSSSSSAAPAAAGSSSSMAAMPGSSSSSAAGGGGGVVFPLPALCNAPTSCPASTTQVPTPWLDLEFSSQVSGSGYNYLASSNDGCPHTGVIATGANGGNSDGTTQGFVDLNAASTDPAYGGAVLPATPIGTPSSNAYTSAAGWSYEVTLNPSQQTSWAKIMCLGNGAGEGDIILGYSGGNLEFDFTIDTTTGAQSPYTQNGAGNIQVIQNPNVALNTWYHLVVVQQQVDDAGIFGSWFVYVNGVLQPASPDANNAPFFMPPPIARPQSYVGRSCYSNDELLVAEIDTFRIYNNALNQEQVTALYAQQMAACSSAVTFTSTPVSTSTFPNTLPPNTAVAPVFSLDFASDPSPAALPDVAGYGWEQSDFGDAACGIDQYHQGLLVLEGTPDYNDGFQPDFSFVNLSTTTGPATVGVLAPMVGGAGYGSGSTSTGSAGLTFEFTFKPALEEIWGKLMDFGEERNAPLSGQCNNDIVFGWVSNSLVFMNFEVCDGNGNGLNTADFGPFLAGSWYHVVITLQELSNGMNNWYIFVNGVALGTMANNPMFPASVVRQNANLGKSGWNDQGWSGWLDTFNIYDQAMSYQQVSTLYTAALGPMGTLACPVIVGNSSTIRKSDIYYDLDFATNPSPNPATASYAWLAFDPADSAADQLVHTGLVNFSGCTDGGCNGVYINMSANSGPYSVGKVLGDVGGLGTGSIEDGSVGWSFEFTFKVAAQTTWSKLMDLGDGTGGGYGIYEILWGWHASDQFFTTTIEYAGNQDYYAGNNTFNDDLYPATPVLNFNQWYHTVVVFQYNTALTDTPGTQGDAYNLYNDGGFQFSGYAVYTDGVLTANATQKLYPPRAHRYNSLLGKSNYGDSFWLGEIDTFRVYSVALNPAQVNALHQAALSPPLPPPGSSSSTGSLPAASSSMSAMSSSTSAMSSAMSSSTAAVAPVMSSSSIVTPASSTASSSAAASVPTSSSSAAAASPTSAPSSSSAPVVPISVSSSASSSAAQQLPTAATSSSNIVPPPVQTSTALPPPVFFTTSSSSPQGSRVNAAAATTASSLLVAATVVLACLLSLLL